MRGPLEVPLSGYQRFVKRAFDMVASSAGLIVFGFLLLPMVLVIRLDTGESGIFRQKRVGLHGKYFDLMKLCTMR